MSDSQLSYNQQVSQLNLADSQLQITCVKIRLWQQTLITRAWLEGGGDGGVATKIIIVGCSSLLRPGDGALFCCFWLLVWRKGWYKRRIYWTLSTIFSDLQTPEQTIQSGHCQNDENNNSPLNIHFSQFKKITFLDTIFKDLSHIFCNVKQFPESFETTNAGNWQHFRI